MVGIYHSVPAIALEREPLLILRSTQVCRQYLLKTMTVVYAALTTEPRKTLSMMEAGYTTPEFTEPLPPEMDQTPWATNLKGNRFRQPIERGSEFALQRERAKKASTVAKAAIESTQETTKAVKDHKTEPETLLRQGRDFFIASLVRKQHQHETMFARSSKTATHATADNVLEPAAEQLQLHSSPSAVSLISKKPYEDVSRKRAPSNMSGKRKRSPHKPLPRSTTLPRKRTRCDSVMES